MGDGPPVAAVDVEQDDEDAQTVAGQRGAAEQTAQAPGAVLPAGHLAGRETHAGRERERERERERHTERESVIFVGQ